MAKGGKLSSPPGTSRGEKDVHQAPGSKCDLKSLYIYICIVCTHPFTQSHVSIIHHARVIVAYLTQGFSQLLPEEDEGVPASLCPPEGVHSPHDGVMTLPHGDQLPSPSHSRLHLAPVLVPHGSRYTLGAHYCSPKISPVATYCSLQHHLCGSGCERKCIPQRKTEEELKH